MVFVLDNYDSFTYNLVQYLGELGAEVVVRRNDEVTPEEVEAMKPERILLSPGPCTPGEAGILVPLIRHMAGSPRRIPILGVCLGHQAIGEAFGGKVIRAKNLMHGKTSAVDHDGTGVFAGLPTPLTCTRYHSLIVEEKSLPVDLRVTARTAEANGSGSVIMGLRHRTLPVEGVQFHPESVLTEGGHQMIRNFLGYVVMHQAPKARNQSAGRRQARRVICVRHLCAVLIAASALSVCAAAQTTPAAATANAPDKYARTRLQMHNQIRRQHFRHCFRSPSFRWTNRCRAPRSRLLGR